MHYPARQTAAVHPLHSPRESITKIHDYKSILRQKNSSDEASGPLASTPSRTICCQECDLLAGARSASGFVRCPLWNPQIIVSLINRIFGPLVLPNCYINTPFASIMMEWKAGTRRNMRRMSEEGEMMDRIWMEGEDVYTKWEQKDRLIEFGIIFVVMHSRKREHCSLLANWIRTGTCAAVLCTGTN